MIDPKEVGNFALEALDAITDVLGGRDAEVVDMMLIVAVRDHDARGTRTMSHATNDLPHVQLGLVNMVAADIIRGE